MAQFALDETQNFRGIFRQIRRLMTVKQLKMRLDKMPQNAVVTFCTHEGYAMGTVKSVSNDATLDRIKKKQITLNCLLELIYGNEP